MYLIGNKPWLYKEFIANKLTLISLISRYAKNELRNIPIGGYVNNSKKLTSSNTFMLQSN